MRLTDPRLVRYAVATRVFLLAAAALGLLTATLVIAQATLLADVVARAFGDGATLQDLRVPLSVLAVVVAGRAVLAWGGDVLAHRTGAAVTSTLRLQLVRHAVRSRPLRVSAGSAAGSASGSAADGAVAPGSRTADLTTVAARGIDALDVYFARYLPALVLAAVVPVVVAARIFAADWASAVLIVLTLPLIPLFTVLVGWLTRVHVDRGWRRLAMLSRGFLDLVAGLPTLRVFGRAQGRQGQVETIRRLGEQHRQATMGTLRIAFLSALVLELVATLSVALVAVGVGLRLVSGTLDLETGLLVLVLAPEAYWPLRHLAAQYHASAEGVAAADRVFAVLDTPLPPTGGRTDVPDPSVVPVHVQGLSVRYAGRDTDAVHQLTLTLSPGRTVALVGPSGSGKSSVLAVLLGFAQPSEGRVLVGDDPLSELDLDVWRRTLAYLPQRPTLFAGTVAENIALGARQASPSEVRAAARSAGAEEFVDALPGGFSYRLGEGAAELSAGQRQRIALARVFFADADLVLLDEPTANLDADSEALVASAVRRLAVGRTVLLAAHRPALVLDADETVQLSPVGVPG